MKIVEVDTEKFRGGMGKARIIELLEEFHKSNMNYAEILFSDEEYVNHKSCYASFHRAVKYTKLPIAVSTFKGHVYLSRNVKIKDK